jgi:Putative transposase
LLPNTQYLLKAFDAGKLEFFSSLESLRDRCSFLDYLAPLRAAEWVVYAKRPFAGPEQVLDYVGRYTHRVAISNNRLLEIAEGKVTFRYKDYRHDAQQKTMTVQAEEFIPRFLLHVLPEGFQRIRYYGLLGNRYRAQKLAHCRELLGGVYCNLGPTRRLSDHEPPSRKPIVGLRACRTEGV